MLGDVRGKIRALGYHLDKLPPTLSTEHASQVLDCSRGAVWAAARDEGGIVVGDDLIRPIRVGRSLRWPTAPILRALGLLSLGADETADEPALRLVPSDSESRAGAE